MAAAVEVAVVLPAFNERARIASVLGAVGALRLPEQPRLTVVDDGSSDGTAEAARAAGARVFSHRVNLGKGASLLTGVEAAVHDGAEVVVLMDADGQHEPADLALLLEPLREGRADLVLGYRRFAGEMPLTMRFGNRLLSGVFATLFGLRVRDTQCGYRAFRAEVFEHLRWAALDYAVETEMLVRAARRHVRIEEVPIATVYHDRYKGTTPVDGIRILANMLRWRLA
jgi:glycosyltransferase involved in cell wall biosynthesis